MILAGLQKLTLLDYPGLVACTVFTAGCNLRCPFCHNATLVTPGNAAPEITEAEFFTFLEKRTDVLDGVAVTGGEPLLHPDLPKFLEQIKALGYKIKLDTNGTFPSKLKAVVSAGLVDRVAMDIKNAPEKYAVTTGVPVLDLCAVKESAAFLLEGTIDYEFRTTAVRGLHEPADFRSIGQWIAGAHEYYIQNFRDSGNIIDGTGLSAFTDNEINMLAKAVSPFVPAVKIRGI